MTMATTGGTVATKQELSINDLAAQVVRQDPELKAMMKQLITDAVGEYLYAMRHGDQALKISLAKALVPYMLKAIQSAEDGEADKEKKEAYKRMTDAMMGRDIPVVESTPIVTEDAPPGAPRLVPR